jgi:hypothetical protein
MLPHNPYGGENVAVRKTRYIKTLELYNEAFGSIPPKDIWADYMDTSNIPMDELQVAIIIPALVLAVVYVPATAVHALEVIQFVDRKL